MKIWLITTLLLISSCSTTIKNFEQYQKEFLSKSAFLPDKETLEGKLPKVVVFTLDESSNEVAQNANLGTSLANNIENILTRDRLVELVDRSAAKKLEKEIALAEMNKSGSYKGLQIANYAVSGAISNAAFTSTYSSGSTYVNPKDGQLITIPPKFTYSSSASGNIKIYELPSLTVVETIEFSGRAARSENVRQDGGVSLGALQIGGKKVAGATRDDGLVRKAGEDAIADIIFELKNAFAKKGYILEKRTLDDKAIFKISLGALDGIKQDDEFAVIGQYEVENPITNEIEIERRIIAHGKVSDKIDPKNSWVVLNESNTVNSVRLGDMVKMQYQRNGFQKFTRKMRNF